MVKSSSVWQGQWKLMGRVGIYPSNNFSKQRFGQLHTVLFKDEVAVGEPHGFSAKKTESMVFSVFCSLLKGWKYH